MVLEIRKYPDSVLKKEALPVEKISRDILKLADAMIETMLKQEGLGLAANQVGVLHRVFVLNTTPHEDTPKPIVLINPAILSSEDAVAKEEGCLSFPDLYLIIPRSDKIRIYAKNLYNEGLVYETSGLLARAIQHEIDHLNGILFIEHAAEVEQKKLKRYLDNLNACAEKE